MRFLINWRESGLHRSLKKRYSKTIKGQKRVWIAFGVTDRAAKRFMKKRGSAVLLAAVCLLVGCAASDPALPAETSSPTETSSPAYQGDSLFAYCTERQRELLELPHEELPVELIFHHWTETAADYETRDETVIAGVLQALRDVSVKSESPIISTDNRGLTFVTAQGDTYSFWFDKRRFEGVDGRCYVLSEDEKLWELVWGIRAADPDIIFGKLALKRPAQIPKKALQ